MSWSDQLSPVWQIIGPLSFAVCIVVGAAMVFHSLVRSSYWRKAAWQVAILALGLLLLGDLSGQTRNFIRSKANVVTDGSSSISSLSFSPNALSEQTEHNERFLIADINTEPGTDRAMQPVSGVESGDLVVSSGAARELTHPSISKSFWGISIWMIGTSMLIARLAISRLLLLRLLLKSSPIQKELLSDSLQNLAESLGLRRKAKFISSDQFPTPVAFGILSPTIAVPADFWKEYNHNEQQAVLAHELAHLAGRDPLWGLFSDVIAALLWWHPMVWWAHHQLRETMEAVADEAAILVPDGPNTLAACLVRLGSRLVGISTPGSISTTGSGFRSGLARRVEHLLNLRRSSWDRPAAMWSVAARFAGTLLLTIAAMVSLAWTHPDLEENTTMKTLKQNWKQSLGAMALLVGITQNDSELSRVSAQVPANRGEAASQREVDSRNKGQNPPQQRGQPQSPQLADPQQTSQIPVYKMDPVLARRYGLIPSETGTSAQNPGSGLDPNVAQRYGLVPIANESETDNQGNQELRSLIAKRLEEIVVESAHFEEIPLTDVIRRLYELSRTSGEEKQGINFLLSNVVEPVANQIDPLTGAAMPALTTSSEELGRVIVRLDPPLRNVRLKDLLNAITKVASEPIRYTIEDYGVLFSFDSSRPRNAALSNPFGMALEVGTFHVEEASLIDGAAQVFDIRLNGQGDSRFVARKLIEKLGVNTEKPNLFFYNPKTSILMVRATKSELDLIRATMETLIGQSIGPADKQERRPGSGAFEPSSSQTPLNGKSVSILGHVKEPGNVVISETDAPSLLQVIASSGGFTKTANQNLIQLIRDGKKQQFRLDDLQKAEGTESMIRTKPGDVIMVPEKFF